MLQVARTTQVLALPDSLPDDTSLWDGTRHADIADISRVHFGGNTQSYLGVAPDAVLSQQQGSSTAQVQCIQQVLPLLESNLSSQVACLAATLCTAANSSGPPSLGKSPTVPALPGQQQSAGVPSEQQQQSAVDTGVLLAAVPERRAKLEAHKAGTHAALARQISLASQLVKLLSQLSDELQEFARKHIMDKQQALDQFRVQLATEHCRSLCHKLQVVELQIDSSVYTQDSIAALSKVRDHLSSRRAAVSSALKDVKQSLQAYADLGEPFAKVAKRYLAVHTELASVQQSLATFAELERELTGPH
mmetsp:Transcript_29635/g.76843  ORF Transcript_29635/g.76843 Transcript_29635/m.76843 type:complete len:305 (-) Transcript_29635:363-1277(-)